MKNIQIIDSADNCTYDIFSTTEDDFRLIFPGDKDIEFIDDFLERVSEEEANKIIGNLWDNWVDKKNVQGIHGTLFYQLELKKEFYPNKKETDIWVNYRK